MDDQIEREQARKKQAKPKTIIDVKKIESLNRSEAVEKALKDSLEIPSTSSQFERDYKSLQKNQNIEAKLGYLSRIDPNNLKKIFRSNLETDILMDIIKTFNSSESFIG